MSEPIIPAKIYFKTWAALLALLLLTTGAAYVNLGRFNLLLALTIAIAKALLIVLFFMHIKWSSRLLHLAAFAGILWLGIMLTLTLGDYLTRGWVPFAGQR
jgi:cytochrome c oxidase subunit 4